MTNFAKVKDHTGLVREMHSKAILNVDDQALKDHRRKKEMMRGVLNNSEKIDKLENDIEEIKQILLAMIEKNKA